MKQHSLGLVICYALGLLVAVAVSFQARAAQREWTGNSTPGPDGLFETAGNWSLSLPPTLDDQAVFNVPASYTVTLGTSPTVDTVGINAGQVTFESNAASIRQVTTLRGWTQSSGSATLNRVDLGIGGDMTLEGASSLSMPAADLSIGGMLTIGSATPGDAVAVLGGPGSPSELTVLGVTRVGNIAGGTGTLRLREGTEGSFSGVLAVGSAGSGLMEILSGSSATLDGTLLVASQFGPAGSGKLVIDGDGSLLDITGAGEIAVGVPERTAEVQISSGGYLSTGTGLTHIAAGSKLVLNSGEAVVEGALQLDGYLDVAAAGKLTAAGVATLDGQVVVRSGSQLNLSTGVVAAAVGASGNVTVEGAGSLLNTSGTLRVMRTSQLNITSGGRLTATHLALGTMASSSVNAQVVGEGARISANSIVLGGDLVGGVPVAGGKGTLAVGFDGVVEYTGSLHILGQSQLTLDGGELRAPSFATLKDSRFSFEAGTYTVMGNATIDATVVAGLPNGSLHFVRGIAIEGIATLGAPLKLIGGTLSSGQLLGGNLLDFDSGTIAITGGQGLVVGAGGALGATLSIGNESRLAVSHSLTVATTGHLVIAGGGADADNVTVDGQLELTGPTSAVHFASLDNHGQLSGEGRLMGGPVTNSATGIIAVSSGRQLRLGGTGHTNAGRIELAAGRLEVDGHFTNLPGGDMVGRGTLSFGEGLTNQGDLIFASGATDIFGDVNNTPNAKVLISGGAEVVFWDDVTHNGATFNVSTGSSVTFFGQAGFSVSGGGDVYFEEDISPGNSPGLSQFGGDVYFGGGSHLLMELGGTTRGIGYDSLAVADTAHLGGELTVALIDGFVPQIGSQFQLVSAADRDGTFAQLNLPYIGSGRAFTTHYDDNSMWLSVVATDPSNLLPGDYNDDGVVDAGDYVVWRNNVGTSVALANDEFGGSIGSAHYLQWKQNYGARREGLLVAAVSAVPEPSALVILLPGAALLAWRRAGGRPCRNRRRAD